MSRLPKVDKKPKNNRSNKFRWVDSQWEKFMTEQKELKKQILQLEMENAELKDMVLDLGGEYKEDSNWEITNDTGNGDFEVKRPMIYESPDGGRTVYGRRVNSSFKSEGRCTSR